MVAFAFSDGELGKIDALDRDNTWLLVNDTAIGRHRRGRGLDVVIRGIKDSQLLLRLVSRIRMASDGGHPGIVPGAAS